MACISRLIVRGSPFAAIVVRADDGRAIALGNVPVACRDGQPNWPASPTLCQNVSSAREPTALRERLHRWLSENVSDTRVAGGPSGRTYAAPFAQVWDAFLDQVSSRRGWNLAHQDEDLGIITIRCQILPFRPVDDLTVWVGLDENGLTWVEALSRSRVGKGDMGVNRRRIVRMLATLDAALGPHARLRHGKAAAETTASASVH